MSDKRLWLLQPVNPESDPWVPWYDKAFGFVVRAESETEAREIAQHEGGDEVSPRWSNPAWTDSANSSCEELLPDGEVGVIIRDLASA